ncbi:hypothetical protein NDU88_011604 [Pleurodeles waltl]|uniref:Uncharacterized protein n=1 Tax=Pleurodeles waltl TaxID=8319 RepID=A0AAV7S4Q8_PLEWA|nr:hypothetical protein NDU88_011604 [Pleurodeles waltl]
MKRVPLTLLRLTVKEGFSHAGAGSLLPAVPLGPRGRAPVGLLPPDPTPAAAPAVRCPASPATVRQARKSENLLPQPLRGCWLLATSQPHLRLHLTVKRSEHRLWLRQPTAAPGTRRLGSRSKSRQIRGDLSVPRPAQRGPLCQQFIALSSCLVVLPFTSCL